MPDGVPLNLSHREYFKRIKNGFSTMTDPMVSAVKNEAEAKKMIVVLSVPYYENNAPAGGLIAQVNDDFYLRASLKT